MRRTTAAVAAMLLAAVAVTAAATGARAAPAITAGGVSARGIALGNAYRAQRRNDAVINRVQGNIRASQRARYRAQ